MGFIFLLLNLLIATAFAKVHNLTDDNFDKIVRRGEQIPWVVMFHVRLCNRCVLAHEIFETFSNTSHSAMFGRVECNENSFTCLRFDQLNVSKMPNLILIDKGNYFEQRESFQSVDQLEVLLNEEKTVEHSRPVPPSIGYFGLIKRVFNELINIADVLLDELANEQLGLNISWNRGYTITLFLAVIVTIILVEWYMFNKFCRSKRRDCKPGCTHRHVHVKPKIN